MRAWLRGLAVLTLLAAGAVRAGDAALPGVSMHGAFVQGGLVFGHAQPGTRLSIDGRPLRLTADGAFVFGFDRDAAAQCTLVAQRPGRAPLTRNFAVRKGSWRIQRIEGLPPDLVTPPPQAGPRIAAEAQLLAQAHERDSDIDDFREAFAWPAQGRVSGVFGSQRILDGVPKQPHYGLDIAVPVGTPVRAPAGGIVSLAQADLYFTGGTLVIDHGHGLASVLVHLSRLLVRPGERVARGQVVALSGKSGRATGAHLHWGLYWFDAHVDARRLLH